MDARIERLIRRAERYLAADEAIPLDLAAALMECGIDVNKL